MGTQLPLPKGGRSRSPQFSDHVCCGQIAGWIKMPLDMEKGLVPGDFVLDDDPASSTPQKRGQCPSPIFGPCPLWLNGWMDQDGTWHRGGPWSRQHCARLGPSSPPKKGGGRSPSQFSSHFYSARNARIASAVLAIAIPSVRSSVCPFVRPSVRLSVRPSVCPSVTRRYCVKMTARSTVEFAPLDSKMCLVF